jgi:hypothetical protein
MRGSKAKSVKAATGALGESSDPPLGGELAGEFTSGAELIKIPYQNTKKPF